MKDCYFDHCVMRSLVPDVQFVLYIGLLTVSDKAAHLSNHLSF